MRAAHQPDDHCPLGFRLLIQLVDTASIDDARDLIRVMYGQQTAEIAKYSRGTERPTVRRDWYNWQRCAEGFRVYIPFGHRVGMPR